MVYAFGNSVKDMFSIFLLCTHEELIALSNLIVRVGFIPIVRFKHKRAESHWFSEFSFLFASAEPWIKQSAIIDPLLFREQSSSGRRAERMPNHHNPIEGERDWSVENLCEELAFFDVVEHGFNLALSLSEVLRFELTFIRLLQDISNFVHMLRGENNMSLTRKLSAKARVRVSGHSQTMREDYWYKLLIGWASRQLLGRDERNIQIGIDGQLSQIIEEEIEHKTWHISCNGRESVEFVHGEFILEVFGFSCADFLSGEVNRESKSIVSDALVSNSEFASWRWECIVEEVFNRE